MEGDNQTDDTDPPKLSTEEAAEEARKPFPSADNVSTISLYSGIPPPPNAQTYTLSVRKAALVGDPMHPKTWAERRIKSIFIYWICMFLLVAILNACTVYTFLIIPDIYARKELESIYLFPEYYFTSIIGVEISIVLTCFFAFYILAFPDENHWRVGNFRWFGFVVLNGYIIYCLVCYARDSDGMMDRIEIAMKKGFTKEFSKIPFRFNESHDYFFCCGVKSYKDWLPYLSSNSSYPSSCCNKHANPSCDDLHHHLNSTILIHESGCLHPERVLVFTVSAIFFSLSAIFVLSSIICCIFMSMILTYVGGRDIKIEQANPFFD